MINHIFLGKHRGILKQHIHHALHTTTHHLTHHLGHGVKKNYGGRLVSLPHKQHSHKSFKPLKFKL